MSRRTTSICAAIAAVTLLALVTLFPEKWILDTDAQIRADSSAVDAVAVGGVVRLALRACDIERRALERRRIRRRRKREV